MNIYDIIIKIIWIILSLFVIPIYFFVTIFILTRIILSFLSFGIYIAKILKYKTRDIDKEIVNKIKTLNKIFWLGEEILILAILLFYFFRVYYLSNTMYLMIIVFFVHILILFILGLIYGSKLGKYYFHKKCQ